MSGQHRRVTLLGTCLAVLIGLEARALLMGGSQPLVQQVADASDRPADNRFTPVVLVSGGELDEPMVFQVLDDERVLIIERKGALKMYDPGTGGIDLIATIPVNTKYTNAAGVEREAEEGLVGLTLDPDFNENGWIYMVYADPRLPKHVLARWELRGNQLVAPSKRVLLEWSVQRYECCHTGGGMTWDADGNLFLTVGNNTSNFIGAQTDERPGREAWDDQRGAANTNDLRGKILRIHPEPDGTYSIPPGNLFPPGTPGTRPEIYTMGNRNPWRPFIDSQTGFLYWGEVGPDAAQDSELGPMGYDEHNQARGPGNFGWPYFIGANRAFPYYDFALDRPLEPKDPGRPTNTSVNNTGLEVLPPAEPALIYYPYGPSEEFPLVGTGARSANGGPIYRRADFENPARPFPSYYEGKWFTSDFSRGWIMVVTLDGAGDYVSMERFVPDYQPVEILDNKFGPNGDFYVLEYGSTWFAKSNDAKLVRIEYNGGNRPPQVEITSNVLGAPVPFDVELSSAGTTDFDGDAMTYEWRITSGNTTPRVLAGESVTVTLDAAGSYEATLTVTDSGGASASRSLTLVAGNGAPSVEVDLVLENSTFFFPEVPIEYNVRIADAEDGAIDESRVAFGIDYLPESFDTRALERERGPVDPTTRFAPAREMMARTDCGNCHGLDTASAGPSFRQLSERYRDEVGAIERLAGIVQDGGSGVWGEGTMPAHPTLMGYEARQMVRYMLGVHDPGRLPLTGRYTPVLPDDDPGTGSLLFRAVYTDGGAGSVAALTSDGMALLRSPRVSAASAEVMEGVETRVENRGAGPVSVLASPGGHIGFRQIDLTGIGAIELSAQVPGRESFRGGTVELRLDSATGPRLGQVEVRGGQQGRGRGRGRGAGVRPRIEVSNVDGVRDVFLVFSNSAAAPSDRLLVLTELTFVQN